MARTRPGPRKLAARRARLLLLIGLATASACGNSVEGPLARLHLGGLLPTVDTVNLTATAQSPAGPSRAMSFVSNGSDPLDLISVQFAPGTLGSFRFDLQALQGKSCLTGSGTGSVNLISNDVFEVPVALTPPQLACGGQGSHLTIQVVNGVGGSGTVVSHPSGLSCSGPGTLCDSYYPVGTTLTLEAQPSSGLFLGWSLPGCPGVGECKLTLTNDVQIQATFATCHGFCPEQVPYGISGNLYGVGGTGVSSVLVAGDQGLLLQSTGNGKWTALPSGTTASLRAVAGATIGGKPLLYAVGDGGTILQWSGSLLSDLSRPALSSANLHAVGFGPGSSPNAYFLGDSGTVLQLPPGGTLNLQTLDNTVAGKTLNAVSQNPNSSSEDLYVVGNSGFSESWTPSGLPRETTQSSRLSQNLNAALCLSNYFYVAGDGGAISRRSSSGGNSNNWMVMTTPGTANLRGLWGSSASNLYAVGDGGTLWSSDGTSWSAVNTSTPQSLHAVWGTSSTNLYVVGDHATILHYLP